MSSLVLRESKSVLRFLLGVNSWLVWVILLDNLQDDMVTSMHTVYEEVLHLGVMRHFPINNSLLLSSQSSGTKHKNDLEQKDKEFEDSADSQKPK